jgi:predicted outer membrane repeat protein
MRRAFLLLSLLASPQLAHARTWYVTPDGGGDAPTIQAAIDSCDAGDDVLIASGVYFEHDIALRGDLWLHGEAGAKTTFIDAQGIDRALVGDSVDDVTIEGVTIRGGESGAVGAGIRLLSSTATIRDCALIANHTTDKGGAIGAAWSAVTLQGTTLSGNGADGGGGAIYGETSSFRIFDSVLADNRGSAGGAIFSAGTAVEIQDSQVTGNHADRHGGGVYVNRGRLLVHGCEFRDNQALPFGEGTGGAIAFRGTTWLWVTGTRFLRNESASMGGGVAANRGNVWIEGCTFVGNRSGDGGGLSVIEAWPEDPPDARVLSSTFEDNTAEWLGGGAQVELGYRSEVELADCSFFRNHSEIGGGASLGLGFGPRNCVFAGNSATQGGGALNIWDVSVPIEECTIAFNTSDHGAGVYLYYTETGDSIPESRPIHPRGAFPATFDRCIIAFNGPGEGIYVDDQAGIRCSDVFGNGATDYGVLDEGENFALDPLFCGPALDNYQIRADSPCLPGNHPGGVECGTIGALPEGCEAVPVELVSWSAIKSRYRR